MNTNVLSNPAPDSGYNAILGALAPQAAPPEGSLGSTTPSVHNRVKQTFVNPVATYPFIARKWSEHFEVGFHAGDLIFVFTGEAASKSSKTTILANLPTLNHVLRSAALDPGGKYSGFDNPDHWQYVGVMRNSSGAALDHTVDNGAKRGGNAISPDRIINVDVRGATRMFNYWCNARSGDHVWLAWRQVAIDTPRNSVNQLINPIDSLGHAHHAKLNETSTRCVYWQLLPYSGSKKDYEHIQWKNEVIASPTIKRPIRAGWVFQSLGAGEMPTDATAVRKATQVAENRFQLPMLHAFLNV